MHIFGDEDMSVPDHLMREFKFENFLEAKALVDKISIICEAKNHHADIHFGWGYVIVELTTHDQGKVTELDFDVANSINEVED